MLCLFAMFFSLLYIYITSTLAVLCLDSKHNDFNTVLMRRQVLEIWLLRFLSFPCSYHSPPVPRGTFDQRIQWALHSQVGRVPGCSSRPGPDWRGVYGAPPKPLAQAFHFDP